MITTKYSKENVVEFYVCTLYMYCIAPQSHVPKCKCSLLKSEIFRKNYISRGPLLAKLVLSYVEWIRRYVLKIKWDVNEIELHSLPPPKTRFDVICKKILDYKNVKSVSYWFGMVHFHIIFRLNCLCTSSARMSQISKYKLLNSDIIWAKISCHFTRTIILPFDWIRNFNSNLQIPQDCTHLNNRYALRLDMVCNKILKSQIFIFNRTISDVFVRAFEAILQRFFVHWISLLFNTSNQLTL